MNRKLIAATIAGLLGWAGPGLAAKAVNPNALEPCSNGQVSASGLYPTQAEEDAAFAAAKDREEASTKIKVSESGG